MKFVAIFLAGLLVASCGGGGHKQDPGGLTADEARALDEAAEMLQQRRMPPGTLDRPQDGNSERPDDDESQEGSDA